MAITLGLLVLAVPGGAAGERRGGVNDFDTARLFTGPDREALVTGRGPRISLRLPRGATGLRVVLNGRNVSRRVERAGRLRTLDLGPGSGLRAGLNHAAAFAVSSGRRLVDSRSFYWLRPARGRAHARVRLRRLGHSRVVVRVRAGSHAFSSNKARDLRRSLRSVRREWVIRAWLNGRRVEGALDSSLRSEWIGTLSATHGLRHGRNRLRVFVADPPRGRYRTIVRRFRIRPGRPLPGAGHDRSSHVGVRLRLDGRTSRRSARGTRLAFHWRIVERPCGSRARLRNPRAARPSLTPDRPGRYRVRAVVSERAVGAAGGPVASQAAGPGDAVTITVNPVDVLFPVTTYLYDDASQRWGVSIAGQTYLNPAPGGRGMQVLVVDRTTPTSVQNGYVSSVSALYDSIKSAGLKQLVILVNPPNQAAPVASKDVGTFNKVLSLLGVPPIDKSMLTNTGQVLSIIGVPRAEASSGWFVPGGHNGWLSFDSSGYLAFTPRRPDFDSSSASDSHSNTMTINGQQVAATTTDGLGRGWQVVQIDPLSFGVRANQGFRPDDPALPTTLRALASSNVIVAIRSMGVVDTAPIANELVALGASPSVVLCCNGVSNYSLLGGAPLKPANVLEASANISMAGVAPGGRIISRLAPVHAGGTHAPTAQAFPGAPGQTNLQLYDIVYSDSTSWPYTDGGPFPQHEGCDAPGTDTAGYAAALSHIAGAIGLPAYSANLRTAYIERDQETWSDQNTLLGNLPVQGGNGYDKAQFCNLQAQLENEFTWLDSVKEMFDAYKVPYDRAQGTDRVDLQTINTAIQDSLRPNSSANVFWDIFEGVAEGLNLASFFPTTPALGAVLDSVQTAYDMASTFATNSSNSPVAAELSSEVKSLGQQSAELYQNVSAAMDNTRDIVISDYGRLSVLGPAANAPPWVVSSNSIERLTGPLETAASRWYTSSLMPIAYPAWRLKPTGSNRNPTTDNCSTTFGPSYYAPFGGEPDNAQVPFPDASIVALGRGDPTSTSPFSSFDTPDASLVDPFFRSVDQNGLGFYKDWFILRNFTPAEADCIDTAPGR